MSFMRVDQTTVVGVNKCKANGETSNVPVGLQAAGAGAMVLGAMTFGAALAGPVGAAVGAALGASAAFLGFTVNEISKHLDQPAPAQPTQPTYNTPKAGL